MTSIYRNGITEHFGRPRDDAERVPVADEKQEALV
jgi:hypothetical protein